MTTEIAASSKAAGAARPYRARLTIDLGAIAANWRAIDRIFEGETGAAVKADAYGLGVAAVAPALANAGCRTFFTATQGEAAAVCAALPGAPDAVVYVLNGFSPDAGDLDARIRPILNSAQDVRDWASAPAARPAALQIETGMNRLGVTEAELDALICDAGAPLKRLDIALILSHLATADDARHPMLDMQKTRFDALTAKLKPHAPVAKMSLSATGGARLGPDFAYDLARPGIGLYGGEPLAIHPVVRLEAPILRVWSVAAGETSGYGAAWTAQRPSRLATIPLGYADGAPRSLGDVGRARIAGREAPFAGRVSMDLIVLDVTDLPQTPRPGDVAALLDETLTIDRMAGAAGTIGYEILTRLAAQLGSRAERRYVNQG